MSKYFLQATMSILNVNMGVTHKSNANKMQLISGALHLHFLKGMFSSGSLSFACSISLPNKKRGKTLGETSTKLSQRTKEAFKKISYLVGDH